MHPQHTHTCTLPHGALVVILPSLITFNQGTTFSGVAFAFATNTEAKEDIITEWPGAGNQTKQKVQPICFPHHVESSN